VYPVKFRFLSELPLVIVNAEKPEVTVKFTAVALLEPKVLPMLMVEVADWIRVNPPVPEAVKLVAFAMDTMTVAAVVLVRAMSPDPNAMERVLELEEPNVEVVAVNPLRAKVPRVNTVALVTVKASPSVKVAPAPSRVKALKDLPALIMVPVALTVTVPVWLYVIPETSVMLPETVIAAVPDSVPVNPVQLIDLAPVLPVAIAQLMAPDAASKNTSSALVGIAAPPAPPDVVAHLVPAVAFHEAVPPTQKRSGICHLVSRWRSHHGDPVVHTFLFHGRDLLITQAVVVRQVQGVTKYAMRRVKLKVDFHAYLQTKTPAVAGAAPNSGRHPIRLRRG
jgi:hypothetical protein